MFFNAKYLNKGVAWLIPESSPAELLAAFANPINDFVVLANHLEHGKKVKLLVRDHLIKRLLKTTALDLLFKRKWERQLHSNPAELPDFMQFLEMGERKRRKHDTWSMPSLEWNLQKFVKHWFGSPEWVPVTNVHFANRRFRHGKRIIFSDEQILGVYEVPFDDSREVISRRSVARTYFRDSYREVARLEPIDSLGFESSNMRPIIPQPQKPSPFSAHPRITPLDDAVCGRPLRFSVGFSNSPDAFADEQKRIRIADANASEKIRVFVSAEGGTVEGLSMVELALELKAEHVFTVVPLAGLDELVLRASYLFRDKLVGCIVKTIELTTETDPVPRLKKVLRSLGAQVFPLSDPAEVVAPDILLWVQKEKPGYISWQFHVSSAAGEESSEPESLRLEKPELFAASLGLMQSQFATHSNVSIYNELRGLGRQIVKLIPETILEILRQALSGGRSPSVLLVTDEPYVPWELAYLNPEESGRESGAFLGELVVMGRWWSGRNCGAPASSVEIEVISALASDYEGTLKHALREREMLCRDYNAQGIDALLPQVEAWLSTDPHKPGHLAHVALHGSVDADNDVYRLLLEDQSPLTPHQFAGFPLNKIPRFAAVFLNACQVGGAGQKLGFLSGFPGAVAEAGTQAFIAPLWEVKDESALKVAETFYRYSFGDEQRTVGETFRDIRATALESGSITPLAYMFYGHPLLRLSKSPVTNDES